MTPSLGRYPYNIVFLVALCLCCGVSVQNTAYSQEAPNISRNAGGDAWIINFNNTDINTVIHQVAQITGENYVVPPNLKGNITVISQTALNKNEVKNLLLSALYINGFTVVPSGRNLIIQPSNEARKNVLIDKSGKATGEAFITRVLPVKYANLNELVQALQQLVSDFAVLRTLPDSNAILIADKASNVQKVEQLIHDLDYPETDDVETVKLNNGWVGDVMPLLQKLAPRELGASGKISTSPIRVVGDEHTNSIMLKGDRESRRRLRALIAQLDQPANDDASVVVIPLHNADAAKIADMLKDMFAGPPPAMATGGTDSPPFATSIRANVPTNSLVIHAPSSTVREIRRILVQLDAPRTQVQIEAAIVEINDEYLNQLGVQFGSGAASLGNGLVATSLSPSGSSSLASSNAGLATIVQSNNSLTSTNATTGATTTTPVSLGLAALGSGLTGIISPNGNFNVLIQALAANSHANLLSTPSITTVNNEEAKIIVGQNVPFRTGSFDTTSGGSSNPFTTIQRQDVGITLKVTPQISDDNRVLMKIDQEVSSVSPTTIAGAADIVTNKRTINTTILAANGGTIALGGLISDNKTTAKSKVPLLSDIPVIGTLFQSNEQDDVKTDLVVFLRPTVLANRADIEAMNLTKYNGVWDLELGPAAQQHPITPANLEPELNKLYAPNFREPPKDMTLPWLVNKPSSR